MPSHCCCWTENSAKPCGDLSSKDTGYFSALIALPGTRGSNLQGYSSDSGKYKVEWGCHVAPDGVTSGCFVSARMVTGVPADT